jgi:hypothetical protein
LNHGLVVCEYACSLGTKCETIASIWEDDRAQEQSGWDLLAFGPRELVEVLTQDFAMHQEGIDLMVVDEASREFCKPWSSDPEKWKSFQGWRWKEPSNQDAKCRATKFCGNLILFEGEWVEAGSSGVSWQRAIKLW